MTDGDELEDERGVDRAQIRELLALSFEERVDRLISVIAAWDDIRATARTTRTGR